MWLMDPGVGIKVAAFSTTALSFSLCLLRRDGVLAVLT